MKKYLVFVVCVSMFCATLTSCGSKPPDKILRSDNTSPPNGRSVTPPPAPSEAQPLTSDKGEAVKPPVLQQTSQQAAITDVSTKAPPPVRLILGNGANQQETQGEDKATSPAAEAPTAQPPAPQPLHPPSPPIPADDGSGEGLEPTADVSGAAVGEEVPHGEDEDAASEQRTISRRSSKW